MTQADPAWLDAQYNNRARVADHAQIMARWAEASALARKGMAHSLNIRYGDEPAELLDIFPTPQAGAGGRAPVLVFIHGGYWRSLDKSDFSFVAPVFTQAGALVVVPNYGLCPALSMEQIALQMTRALAWVARNAAQHGGDPERIVAVGHSAGGHLAAMLLACRWKEVGEDLSPRLLRSAVSISGLFDLEPLRHTPFLQADLRLTPASVRRLSPAFFARPRSTLVALVGAQESEEFIRQNQLIRDQWGPTTVPVCETVPESNHFNVLNQLVDPAARTHQLVLQQLGLA